jgi:hypothetical protein
MKKNIKTAAFVCIIILLLPSFMFGQQKLAQTGMKFLSLSVDARASGFSGAAASLEEGAMSMFYNPSGMARLENFASVVVGRVQYIADINYNYGGAVFAPSNGAFGVFGVSFENVDYGQLQGTVRADNEQGFVDFGAFSPSAYAIGLGYAKALSEKFAVGGDVRYVHQSLGTSVVNIDPNGNFVEEQNKTNVLAFDFGILYKTGFKSLDFGMDVRNFSREVRYKKESFQLPLIFKLGISMNLMDFLPQIDQNMNSFLFTVEATHPRDYPEQLSFGGEYTFMKLISLRVGYITPSDVEGVSAGIGIKHNFSGFDFSFDYSYTVYQVFNDVNRFSISFAL